ncbi:MAG: T9SS type A sorting domain-containing protein [Adhaeribacter sp.]
MKILLLLLIGLIFSTKALAQSGCTDPAADNYNPNATTDNGSCTYSYTLTNPKTLPASLNESSGLIYTDGQLWTLNDSGEPPAVYNKIYRISETDGSILQTVEISNATNIDWEALTADANYFYIGDFGNNADGARPDLKIYRVSKAAISSGAAISVTADIINFSYQDQGTPVPTGGNKTKFDCEAFLVKDNQLHLFTKDWVTYKTVHYTLPATPGTHTAERKEELAVNGLITDAHISTTNVNEIVLIGYGGNLLSLFMWVVWDYPDNKFFSGNKRRINLGFSIDKGQLEGVTFTTNGNGYISSERIDRSGFIVAPRLYPFSTINWVPLPVTLVNFTAAYKHPGVMLSWQTASEQNNAFFTVERSTDAVHFKEIGQKKGAGNSEVLRQYSFTDPQPITGINYYRLKQTDINGTISYSPVKSVTVASPKFNFKIYPVPALKGKPLQLEYNNRDTLPARITLTGTDGKVWLTKQTTANHAATESLPTEKLQTGLYFLQVINKHHAFTAKVIIQ